MVLSGSLGFRSRLGAKLNVELVITIQLILSPQLIRRKIPSGEKVERTLREITKKMIERED